MKRFFRKLGIVVLIINILLWSGTLLLTIVEIKISTLGDIIGRMLGFIIIALSITALVFLIASAKRCKKCKKWKAMVRHSSNRIGTESRVVREETGETRSEYDGRVTQRHYSDRKYSRPVYEVTYVCKFCGSKRVEIEKGNYS